MKADAANSTVINPSTAKGGTLRFVDSDDFDSVDPGDTYYAYSWNFSRLYGRPLVTVNPAPGQESNKLVPDLATSLGKSSDGNKTWTYTLRDGVKFEDGTPVTSKDVAYAVNRSLDKDVLTQGPTYFRDLLDTKGYRGPYKDKGKTDPAIETPDDKTIVFHLKNPYSGFDYLAQLPATIPVPQAKDTGTKYKQHVVATGPYMFSDVQFGKSYTLVRNPNWSQATDPIRKALPDKITVAVKVNAADVDSRLLSGDADIDIGGAGVQAAAQAKILSDPKLRADSDIIAQARLDYVAVQSTVAPLNNVHCRKAVLWGADRTGLLRAVGGKTNGDLASNLMPPLIPGATKFNLYPSTGDKGDQAKAKSELAACGKPSGFSTVMSYRSDRPKDKAIAESLQQALAPIGIKLTLNGYPSGSYYAQNAGNVAFVKRVGVGLSTAGWGADWNDGFGFISQIVDPRAIRPSGNYNLGVTDKAVPGLIDKALAAPDKSSAEAGWAAVDKEVMEGGYVLPVDWGHRLNYRPKAVTNVVASFSYGMYDYLNMGVTQ